MRLKGRVALVTGASRGIGAGIARCMALEGATVVVGYLRSKLAADQVVAQIRDRGGTAVAMKADVCDYAEVKSMVERGISELGKIDILVTNAGVSGPGKPLIDTPPDEFFAIVQNHLFGSYNCVHTLLPYMRTYGRADIHFISSRNTASCPPNAAAYNAAKGGIETMAKGLAKEERYNGIRVNVVAPGLVETDMTRGDIAAMTGITDMRKVDEGLPFGRLLQPDDIGNLCVFLASPEASHISGEVFYVRAAIGAEPSSFYISGPRAYTTYAQATPRPN
jgi:NAD(P)-dependent dehydrogenase (short-subunit alcohol dehydrogenase family)